ncbi:MAG: molecular chaperone [Bacteriovoracaceae bacterium]
MKLLFLLFIPLIYGFSFNPMSQSIELSEEQKSAQFLLENDSNEKMAVELTVKIRKMDEKGNETLPETKELTVYPPQVIIPPKEKRTIRVNWLGDNKLTTEKAFRVIAEQLPLNVDEKVKRKSGIKMLMKYIAALYVTPKDARSKVEIESYQTTTEELIITVHNKGNKHQILTDPTINFGDKITLKAKDLAGLAGENIMASSRRIFRVKGKHNIPKDLKTLIKINE